jgi:hypothetical protein
MWIGRRGCEDPSDRLRRFDPEGLAGWCPLGPQGPDAVDSAPIGFAAEA